MALQPIVAEVTAVVAKGTAGLVYTSQPVQLALHTFALDSCASHLVLIIASINIHDDLCQWQVEHK